VNVSEEEVQSLNDHGITEVSPMARPSLRMRLTHAILGCRPIDHIVYNKAIGKPIAAGRICPFCFREFPFRANTKGLG
jgi:hypothetical protein